MYVNANGLLMFVLYELGRRSFIDPICCNFCMVLYVFFRLVLANFLFSLRDINLTFALFLPPPPPEGMWYGVILCLISSCYAILTRSKEGEKAVYGYNPAMF